MLTGPVARLFRYRPVLHAASACFREHAAACGLPQRRLSSQDRRLRQAKAPSAAIDRYTNRVDAKLIRLPTV